MKKLIIIALGVICFSYIQAQVSFGIKGGLNLASQSVSGSGISLDEKLKPGIHFGVYSTIMFSEHLGLQPELLYSIQGTKFDAQDDASFNFNYVNVPILLRYDINKFINIHAGPQLGILTSAKSDDGTNEEDVKDYIKSADVAAAFGLGVDLPFGLNFSLRYNLGLLDVESEEDDFEIKNRNIQISVGYKLFGKKN